MRRKIEIATAVAMSALGLPYVWGGDDPIVGYDCSGLVIEILKSVGALPRSGDWTAQDLYRYFRKHDCRTENINEGCLVFFGADAENITHVEYCLGGGLSIGASGGGSRTKNVGDAAMQNAYVKIRPHRKPVTVVNPFIKIM